LSPVYRKKAYTDQYLDFFSHHPLQHKLHVVRTLLDRCLQMVTEEQKRQAEKAHIQEALSRCGYPERTIKRVKLDVEVQKERARNEEA